MIKGKTNILEYIRLNGLVYYQLRLSPDKDAYCFQSDREETPVEREKRFTDTLNTLEPGRYYLEGWRMEKQTKNWYRDYVVIENENIPMVGSAASEKRYFDGAYIEDRISEAVERERLKMRIERLEEEIKDSNDYIKELEENGGNTTFDRIIGRLEPYIPAIISGLTKKNVSNAVMAGIGNSENEIQEISINENMEENDIDKNDVERILSACRRLKTHADNYIEILEWAADYIEANPGMMSLVNNFVNTSKNGI